VGFILELLFEFFGEFALQVFFEALAQAGVHAVRHPDHEPRQVNRWLVALGYALFGAFGGALSVWLLPHYLLRAHVARVAYLLIAPVAVGCLMAALGHWRSRRGLALAGIDRFAFGYVFALAFAVVRFVFAG
jgi:hypothetical protein